MLKKFDSFTVIERLFSQERTTEYPKLVKEEVPSYIGAYSSNVLVGSKPVLYK
jgi:hypothetical protein